MAGAIFQVTVPATIIRSAWRGVGRKASMPKRDMSKRDIALAIISKAQHARPNVSGHTADFRPQLMSASIDVTARFRFRSSGTSSTLSAMACVCVAMSWFTASPSALSTSHVVACSGMRSFGCGVLAVVHG